MSRPSKGERSGANSKGRPKRRAATNYLYKYQLAGDPNRIEENALKRALQESLEEQTSTPSRALVTPKKNINKDPSHMARAIINSSTNSSDVSKGSNNSSSTTNSSNDSRDLSTDNGGSINKRLRSNATLPVVTPPLSKRAKLTTNGHSNSNISNHKRCDNSDTCVLAGSPVPPFNGAIKRTYSRSQQQESKRQSCEVNPRSSTPIAASKRQAASDKKACSEEPLVSSSTQTSGVKTEVKLMRNTTTNDDTIPERDSILSKVRNQTSELVNIDESGHKTVQNQYLNLKRESKNYAYAKMTALKVNPGKSYYLGISKSASSSSKKTSPVGVLNNNNLNKYSGKTSPKGSIRLDSNKSITGAEPRSNNNLKSTSPNSMPNSARQQDKSTHTNKTASKGFQGLHSATKMSIPKNNLSATSQGLHKADRSFNHTLDLSKNQNQASVNVTKKRIAQGSWSLLGVPEEKQLYIRDDDQHPKRLICYPAIKHIEGDVIQVRDSVLLRSGPKQTDLPYIAKVCAFWQDAETGGVMMSLFWYYRPEHTEEGRKTHHLIDEIFASRHRDADSVECIEDKCYVLTFNEYCRYRKRCKMEQVNTTWSLTDVTIPVSNESYPRRNRIPDSSVSPELVFCCRQIYDSRSRRLIKNPNLNHKYGNA